MNPSLGRILAKYVRIFNSDGPRSLDPRTEVERVVAEDSSDLGERYRAFVEEGQINLSAASGIEKRKAAKKLARELEAEEDRLRMEVELIKTYAARNGLRSIDLTRIERKEAEADGISDSLDKIHARLNPVLVEGEPGRTIFNCRYCETEISRETAFKNTEACHDCTNPTPETEVDPLATILEHF